MSPSPYRQPAPAEGQSPAGQTAPSRPAPSEDERRVIANLRRMLDRLPE